MAPFQQARGAKKATLAPTVDVVPADPAASVSAMELDDEYLAGPSKKKGLQRRNSDEQVQRAINGRFALVPVSIWESKRDDSGRSIRDVVRQALKETKGDKNNGRLSTKFWASINEQFGLSESLASSLPQPSLDQEVDDQLLQVLQVDSRPCEIILSDPWDSLRIGLRG